MGKLSDILHGLKPAMLMVIVQIALAGVNVFYKLAANEGISLQVVIAYRFIFAVVTVVPLALVIERKTRPKLTWKIVCLAFVCALFGGSMAQNLYAESLVLTSATYAAAMTNLMPAVTFILAIMFRMEVLGLKTMAGKAKVSGTLMCIGGAMLLTFYKGCTINVWSTHFDLLHKGQDSGGHVAAANNKSINVFLGPLLAFLSCFSAAVSLIIQAKMSDIYPCYLSSTALISLMGSIQSVVYALCTVRDWSQWKLGWNLRLLIAVYMGVIGAGLVWSCIMSSVRMRGPLFVSVFNPLLLVLVALAGSLFLDERLHLGSILGAIIIIGGLYTVLWGKSREMKKITRLVPTKSFAEPNEIESARSSFKSFDLNVVSMAPNFVPGNEILEISNEEEEDDDLESKISNRQSKE